MLGCSSCAACSSSPCWIQNSSGFICTGLQGLMQSLIMGFISASCVLSSHPAQLRGSPFHLQTLWRFTNGKLRHEEGWFTCSRFESPPQTPWGRGHSASLTPLIPSMVSPHWAGMQQSLTIYPNTMVLTPWQDGICPPRCQG